MFPPGRARLATNPVPTGSLLPVFTTRPVFFASPAAPPTGAAMVLPRQRERLKTFVASHTTPCLRGHRTAKTNAVIGRWLESHVRVECAQMSALGQTEKWRCTR